MELEIREGSNDDIFQLKAIWKNVFYDSDTYINQFFEKAYAHSIPIVAVADKKIVAMMFILKAKLTVEDIPYQAGYIYAVATLPEYREQGIMRSMESYATQVADLNSMKFLSLVPASESLFLMYEKLGYKTAFGLGHIVLAVPSETKVSLIECSLEHFLILRNVLFNSKKACFNLDDNLQEYTYYEYKLHGDIIMVHYDGKIGYFAGYKVKDKDCYYINETDLIGDALIKTASTIKAKFNVNKVVLISQNGSVKPYGMIKSLQKDIYLLDKNPYMNLMLN